MGHDRLPERLIGLVALSSGDARIDTVVRLTCGRALSLPPLPSEVDLVGHKSDRESTVRAFAEQFATDVRYIGENQRKQLGAALGDSTFRTVVMTFIADFVPRVVAGFEALGMGKPVNGGQLDWDHVTDPGDELLNGFVPAVAKLSVLDPVTTEVVRLRVAAHHNCRRCMSLRETTALTAGGSEILYEQVDNYEFSDQLTDAQKAALRYVDALIWTPSSIGSTVAAGVRQYFSKDEAVELTLDVMRNATNKIAVSLGTDATRAAEGTEPYTIDADGRTVFACP